MKKLCAWIKNNVILASIYVVLAVSFIMLAFYFCKFNNGLSTNNGDWASFGSYFGSITGLLAFAGVLYTAWQSDKRAKKAEQRASRADLKAAAAEFKARLREGKAKEELIRKEERDLFFKLLELHQNNLNSITYKSPKETYSGIEAVKQLAIQAEKLMLLYLTYMQVRDNGSVEEPLMTKLRGLFNANTNLDLQNAVSSQMRNRYIESKSFKREELRSSATQSYYGGMDANSKYEGYKIIADSLYKSLGFHYGHYSRNFYYILDTIDRFKFENTYYSRVLRAQLSRYEIVVLFYNAISSKSSVEMISLVEKYNIFNEFYYGDITYETENSIHSFVSEMLALRKIDN